MAIRGANKANVPIAVCGEMAGEMRYTRLLLGLGLRDFSMHPNHLLEIKQRVLKSDALDAELIVNKLLKTDDPERLAKGLNKLIH